MSEETSKRIGDYQVLDELGSGGMGRVYRVRNVISDRIDAMKVLLPDLVGQQELAARFLREIKLMASLDHPNIAALRTAFTYENQLVMVMEYVEGETLAARLERGPIAVGDAVNYISQVLSALSYAHQQHVIHRDIKPANMMLTPQGVIKLMDFGIARAGDQRNLTMTGTTLGSLSYMSPEQVKGEPTDARSDLYSVGVSLYELVTGQRPFQSHSDYSIMAAHVKEAPKPPLEIQPGLPAALNEIILIAIAKDPAQRFQTADAFRNALSSVPVPAPPPVAAKTASDVTLDSTAPLPPQPAATPRPVTPAPGSATPKPVTPPPAAIAPPAAASSHRGLYMTLGALIVLAALAVAGVYLPRRNKTEAKVPASTSTAAPAETQSAPSASPTMTPPAASSPSSAPAAPAAENSTRQTSTAPAQQASALPAAEMKSEAMPKAPAQLAVPAAQKSEMSVPKPSAAHRQKLAAQNATPAAQSTSATEATAAQPAAAAGANDIDQLEQQVDQLSNRAAAVNSSLDRLQQSQGSAGYGLRGDIAARQASMKTNLSRAQEAVERGDAGRAKKYLDQTQSDVEALEHFLGR
jgi:serine/threonine-protein kinase